MHQNDVTALYIFFYLPHDPLCVLQLPVQGIHIPQYCSQIYPAFQLLIPGAVGRAQVFRSAASDRPDNFFRLFDFRAGLLRAFLCHLDVAVAMVADEVSFLLHPLYQSFFPGNIFPHKKKRGFHAALFQSV